MVYRLNRISVWPVVKIVFVVNAVLGLGFGLMWITMLMIFGSMMRAMGGEAFPSGFGTLMGVTGLIVIVFVGMIYGALGAGIAALATWLYNILANVVGGIELSLDPVPSAVVPVAPTVDSMSAMPASEPEPSTIALNASTEPLLPPATDVQPQEDRSPE